jgi:hypothetical protein
MNRLALTLAASLLALAAHCAVAADPPRLAPFDGEWSLTFQVDTKPGGESFQTTQGARVSPYDLHFSATLASFRFESDRTLKLEVRENTPLFISSTSRFGAVTWWDLQNYNGLLKATGNGSGQDRERKLNLSLSWSIAQGTGFTRDSAGASMTYRSSQDGSQLTITNAAGTGTFTFEPWKSTWELQPERIEQAEIGPDEVIETATYRGRRNQRLTPLDPQGFSPPLPVIERIELKQVRPLKLVPRG